MRIFAIHDGGSGCCFYRIDTPLRELQKHGYEVTYASGTEKVPIVLSDMQGYDIIVSQRQLSHSGLETWRKARGPFSRLVYETDDDVFSITPENWQAYRLYKNPDLQDAVIHGAEVADLVTVTTDHLADVMREHTGSKNVAILPNSLPDWVLDVQRDKRERPAVGWQGGASHGIDVGLIARPVRQFLKRFPRWDFRLAGTDYRETFKAGDRAVFSNWIPVYEDAHGYFGSIDFDINLAPLADSPFARSKSNVKVLEAGALGIPSIASDCAVYRSFIRHGENGFLVQRDHEWLHYLSVLAGDDGLREAMGAAARETTRDWLIGKTWKLWDTAYAGLFPSRIV